MSGVLGIATDHSI